MRDLFQQNARIRSALPSWTTDGRRRDEALVGRIRAGEKELFYDLVRPHLPAVYSMVQKNLRDTSKVEDIVQESIVQALIHFCQLQSPQFFRAWLIRIAINEARLAWRREKVCFSSIEEDLDRENGDVYAIRDNSLLPSETLEQKEFQKTVHCAIQGLPQKFREVVFLRDIREYSIKETAEKLGISITATKTRLMRGRKRLGKAPSIIELHTRFSRPSKEGDCKLCPTFGPQIGHPAHLRLGEGRKSLKETV